MKPTIFIVFALLANFAWAQSYNDDYKLLTSYAPPKSPNATAMEKFTSVPIGFQTGQLNYSIPIYTIETEGLTIPITLNYSNTGLKVTEVASWVGLGWHLSVGGAITRTVKGIPDDGPMGLMEPYYADLQHRVVKGQSAGLEKFNYFMDITKSLADSEHDMFSFDFLGIRGKFFIDKDGKCVQLPRSKNTIQFTRSSINNLIDKFSIVDENGNTYFFDLKEESAIYTLTNSVTGNTPNYFNRLKGSTWYLTKIQTKNGGQVLFEYAHYSYKKTEKSESYTYDNDGNAPYMATYMTTLVDVYQLQRIYWKNGFVNFAPGSARQDIQRIDPTASVPSLSDISVYRTNQPFTYYPAFNVKWITFEYNETNRLLLKKLNFRGLPVNNPAYQFNYYAEDLNSWPSYDHQSVMYNAQDYWGYYNGVSNSSLLPYNIVPAYPDPLNPVYTGPALPVNNSNNPIVSRAAYPQYAQYGMLKDIIYPTKGKSSFYYEGNTVLKSSVSTAISGTQYVLNSLQQSTDAQNRTLVTLGGVRLKKVEFYEDVNAGTPSLVTNVNYDVANISTKFMPAFLSALYREYLYATTTTPGQGTNTECLPITNKLLFTLHSSPLVNNPAYVVEYGQVTEVSGSGGAGQTVHFFNPTALAAAVYWTAPFAEPPYMEWRGSEAGSQVQTAGANNTILEKSIKMGTNDPDIPYAQQLDSFGVDLKVAVVRNDGCIENGAYHLPSSPSSDVEADAIMNNCFSIQATVIPTENYVIKQTSEKSSLPTGLQLVKSVNYNYSLSKANRLLPQSVSFVESNGAELKTVTSFPQDYFTGTISNTGDPAVNALVNLINSNIKDVPVEIIKTINKNGVEYVTAAKLIIYYPGRVAISEIYELLVAGPIPLSNFTKSYINSQGAFTYDSRYERQTQYTLLDDRDQPLEYLDRKSGYNAIIRDYNSAYAIADVTNCRYNDAAYTSFEADGTGNWVIAGTSYGTNGITGSRSYDLSGGSITKSSLALDKTYIVSYWTTNNAPVSINGTQGSPLKGKTVNGWTYYEHRITGVAQVVIPQSSGLIDELRLYPSGAKMTTYTYTPLIGITSICSPANIISYYSYDGLNRLQVIIDQDGNVVKTIDYQYKQ